MPIRTDHGVVGARPWLVMGTTAPTAAVKQRKHALMMVGTVVVLILRGAAVMSMAESVALGGLVAGVAVHAHLITTTHTVLPV